MIIIIIEGERGREWRRKWGEEEERKDDCGSQNKLLSYSHASNSLRNKSYKYYNIEQQHEHAHSYARASPPTSTDKAIS